MEATSIRRPTPQVPASSSGTAAVPDKLKLVPVKYWAFAGALITRLHGLRDDPLGHRPLLRAGRHRPDPGAATG